MHGGTLKFPYLLRPDSSSQAEPATCTWLLTNVQSLSVTLVKKHISLPCQAILEGEQGMEPECDQLTCKGVLGWLLT